MRWLACVGFLLLGCTEVVSPGQARQALGPEGEGVYFEWSEAGGLEVRTRVPFATAPKPWPEGERGWRLERLDAKGAVVDTYFVEPGTVLRVPEGGDGPPAVLTESGGAAVQWRRDPSVRSVRLLGQKWTLAAKAGEDRGWEWVTLGELPWNG